MSSFTTPLDFRFRKSGRYELLHEFDYHVGKIPSETVIRVPRGFVTDLASVPRILWSIFPPDGPYTKAVVVHDWLYSQSAFKRDYSRADADGILLEAMTVLKVPPIAKWPVYLAVRAFGWMYW